MTKDWLLIFRYLISTEESRIGRTDYWNSVFLAGKTPFNKHCLELAKVSFLMSLFLCLVIVVSLF